MGESSRVPSPSSVGCLEASRTVLKTQDWAADRIRVSCGSPGHPQGRLCLRFSTEELLKDPNWSKHLSDQRPGCRYCCDTELGHVASQMGPNGDTQQGS